MHRRSFSLSVSLGALLVLTAACSGKSGGSSAGATSAGVAAATPDAVRRERLLEILKFKFPQIANYNPAIIEMHESEFKGLDAGVLELGAPNSRQKQGFLISRDEKKLFVLAGDPIDASRSVAVMKAERRAALEKQVAGLPVRGNPRGKVIVLEYSDFQCPYCRQAYLSVI